ncbi:MAG: hypothetical protein J6334_14310 [Kiritimatiellae bacterium]|nr:hypothetical protein [Kiritimatiellia bacterium]
MMKRLRSGWIAFGVALAWGVWAQKPEGLTTYERVFQTELKKIADQYNETLPDLAGDYVLELREVMGRLKKAGDETGAAAAKREAARYLEALKAEPDPFETVPELLKESVVAKPDLLRLAQEDYIGRRTAKELLRNEAVVTLAKQYVANLNKLAGQLAEAGKEPDAEAARKASRRVQVAMQRTDFAARALKDAGLACLAMPPPPDLTALKARTATPVKKTQDLDAATLLTDLPPAIQAFLMKPMTYDPEWPPEVAKWKFEGKGNYAHDFSLYGKGGIPNELGIYAHPKNMRAYVTGTITGTARGYQGKNLEWVGKAAAWKLEDSRALVCRVIFRTRKPSTGETAGPAACVAVYNLMDKENPIASLTAPMVKEETVLYMAKHYSYNRLNIKWEGSKRKRGFTIPDHTPLRVVAGVVGHQRGEEITATIEIVPADQNDE